MPAKQPGSAEALEDYFYATNSLLKYAIRLIEEDRKEDTVQDEIAANAYREAACVQLRLLEEFLSNAKTREERMKKDPRREDDQCLTDFFPNESPRPGTFPFVNRKAKPGEPGVFPQDLRDRLNKTVAHLSLNRGSGKSITDQELAQGIESIWPAVDAFQEQLKLHPDLSAKITTIRKKHGCASCRFRHMRRLTVSPMSPTHRTRAKPS